MSRVLCSSQRKEKNEKMKNTLIALAISAVLNISRMDAAVTSGVGSIASSEQSIATVSGVTGKAQRVTIRVISGQSGKIYIGKQSMNQSTYANVAKVLYPNSQGGWSESFQVEDPSGFNGIVLADLFIAGAVTGEKFVFEVDKVSTDASKTLELFHAGPLAPSAVNTAVCYKGVYSSEKFVAGFEFSVVPGQSGKIRLGKNLTDFSQPDSQLRGVQKVLWPNTGAKSPDSAISESHSIWSSVTSDFASGNGINGEAVCAYPEVYGEFPLLAAWRRSTYSEAKTGNGENGYDVLSFPVTVSSSSTTKVEMGAVGGSKLTISTWPGTTGKVYVGSSSSMNTSTLAGVIKVIYPNPNGGHSDSYVLEFPKRELGLKTANDSVWIKGDVNGELVFVTQELDRMDSSTSTDVYTLGLVKTALSSTPAQVTSTLGKLSRMTFRNVPGQCGKIYIGTSTMNITTYAGVMKVLYPNCGGGIGDEYVVDSGLSNNLDANQFYVAGSSGEEVIVETRKSAWSIPSTTLVPDRTGPLTTTTIPLATSSSHAGRKIQISVIPGQSGKVRVGNTAFGNASQPDSSFTGLFKSLWPNTGASSESNARSESIELFANPANVFVWSEVSGESPLVTVWKLQ